MYGCRATKEDRVCQSEAKIFTATFLTVPARRSLIDVVNDFEFEGGDALLQLARGGLIKPDLVVFVTYGHEYEATLRPFEKLYRPSRVFFLKRPEQKESKKNQPKGSSIDGLCFVKNLGPCSVM